MFSERLSLLSMAAVVVSIVCCACISYSASAGDRADMDTAVKITELDDRIRIETGGKLFTEYRYKNVPRPYFYPVIGPTGDPVVRHWPMDEAENEQHDHRHHRSLWFTHGDVNGHDFWTEQEGTGTIVHDGFDQISSDSGIGMFRSRNRWVADSGQVVCTDTRTYRFGVNPAGRFIDLEITIEATHGDVILGDTKEGSMAIRVAPTMRVRGKVGHGHIVNSEGQRDSEAWGKRAAWCDYYGPVNGQTVGVAIFDHPANLKHPTWWHVREYGLFAANPFGVHDFEKRPEGTGDVEIPSGDSLTFRYRVYLHRGDDVQAGVDTRYREYVVEREIAPSSSLGGCYRAIPERHTGARAER